MDRGLAALSETLSVTYPPDNSRLLKSIALWSNYETPASADFKGIGPDGRKRIANQETQAMATPTQNGYW